MNISIITYVERDGQDIELEIRGSVTAPVRAVTHLPPEYCHPAEGGEVEIISVLCDDGEWDDELMEEERELIEEQLFSHYQDNLEDEGDEEPLSLEALEV